MKQEWDLNNPAPAETMIPTGNSLKENTSGVSVIMPEMDETDEALGELGPKLFIDELSLNEEPGDEKKTPIESDDSDEKEWRIIKISKKFGDYEKKFFTSLPTLLLNVSCL